MSMCILQHFWFCFSGLSAKQHNNPIGEQTGRSFYMYSMRNSRTGVID